MCAAIIFYEDGRELQVKFVVVSFKSLYLGCGRVLILCTRLLEIFSLVPPVGSGPLNYVCYRGTFLLTPRLGPDFCLPCKEGVGFMPESLHRHRFCYNCSQIQDDTVEILTSPCNRTQDTEILCKEGYYRRKARNDKESDTCVQCSDCENVARPCQGYYDTVCCLQNYDAVLSKHGFYVCKERPIVCGAGEFLSLKTEQCTPCPSGTFMTSDKHNHINCQVCLTLDNVGPHQEIVQQCNRTEPTIFKCELGYFNKNTKADTEQISCSPCGWCKRTLQECDPSQDSICCDEPNMFIVETGNTSTCVTRTFVTSSDAEELKAYTNSLQRQKVFCVVNDSLTLCFNVTNIPCLPCLDGAYPETGNQKPTLCRNAEDDQHSPPKTDSFKDSVPSKGDKYIFEIFVCITLFILIAQTSILFYTNADTNYGKMFVGIGYAWCALSLILSFIFLGERLTIINIVITIFLILTICCILCLKELQTDRQL